MEQEVSEEPTDPGGRDEGEREGTESLADRPNPFWSDRATEEFLLRQARPLGLAEYDDRQLEPDYAVSDDTGLWKQLVYVTLAHSLKEANGSQLTPPREECLRAYLQFLPGQGARFGRIMLL